jgi:hypothetical protein
MVFSCILIAPDPAAATTGLLRPFQCQGTRKRKGDAARRFATRRLVFRHGVRQQRCAKSKEREPFEAYLISAATRSMISFGVP